MLVSTQRGQSTASTVAGVAALITAVGGTVGVLYQTGVIHHTATPASSPSPGVTGSPSPGGSASPSPSASSDQSPSASPGTTPTPTPSPGSSPTSIPTAAPTPSHGIVIH